MKLTASIQSKNVKEVLKEMVDSDKAMQEKPLFQPKSRIKQPTPQQETPRIKRTYSLPCSLPKMGIMFTNADQLTTSKLKELKRLV